MFGEGLTENGLDGGTQGSVVGDTSVAESAAQHSNLAEVNVSVEHAGDVCKVAIPRGTACGTDEPGRRES